MEKQEKPQVYEDKYYLPKVLVTLFGAAILIKDLIKIYNISCWYYLFIIPGWVVADLIAGIVHWFGDSYSGYGMEFLFHDFLEHHREPSAMLKRDYFQISFDTYILYILASFAGLSNSFMTCVALFAMQANFCHRESHKYNKAHWTFKILQSLGLSISPKAHHVHHTIPYNRDYCVFSGFLNPLLQYIDFWRRVERTIYFFTSFKSVEMRRLHPKLPDDENLYQRFVTAVTIEF